MDFPDITEEENKISLEEGLRIFGELRKKYSNKNIKDLDIVLNSICCALTRLTALNVRKQDYETFAEIIKSIILRNLVLWESNEGISLNGKKA
jgi:hypothetical protein